MFNRIKSSRTMHKWTPSIVKSRTPVVPSAQPSQTPRVRMRHAKGSSPRLRQMVLAISK